MNARGLVVSATNVIHKVNCSRIKRASTRPLSSIAAPKRRALGKCRVCKP